MIHGGELIRCRRWNVTQQPALFRLEVVIAIPMNDGPKFPGRLTRRKPLGIVSGRVEQSRGSEFRTLPVRGGGVGFPLGADRLPAFAVVVLESFQRQNDRTIGRALRQRERSPLCKRAGHWIWNSQSAYHRIRRADEMETKARVAPGMDGQGQSINLAGDTAAERAIAAAGVVEESFVILRAVRLPWSSGDGCAGRICNLEKDRDAIRAGAAAGTGYSRKPVLEPRWQDTSCRLVPGFLRREGLVADSGAEELHSLTVR